jgi:hypothetical protein
MQCVVRNIVLNVRQQIFVRGDSKSGRSVLPLNLKGAASVEIGKSGDGSFLSFDPTIASNAGQMASDNQNDTRSKQNDRDLSHVEIGLLRYDAATLRFGFNKSRTGLSPERPSGGLAAFDEVMATKGDRHHCKIFIFTASTRTPST